METENLLLEEAANYFKSNPSYPFQDEAYQIIGICMEVYNQLGRGFMEAVYKDALEYEFNHQNIVFQREKKYDIRYKGTILKHAYYADFVVHDKIILEVKAQEGIVDNLYKQVINYLAVSQLKLGLLVNFGEHRLSYKRVILEKEFNTNPGFH
jgi:GxxExxY protein